MVPGSTLMYGSSFCIVTRYPWSSSSRPIEAAASPLPSDDTTPPVTKMYFTGRPSGRVIVRASCARTDGDEPPDAFKIFRGIDFNGLVQSFYSANTESVLECPQLFE